MVMLCTRCRERYTESAEKRQKLDDSIAIQYHQHKTWMVPHRFVPEVVRTGTWDFVQTVESHISQSDIECALGLIMGEGLWDTNEY